jgi:hypothetical protein
MERSLGGVVWRRGVEAEWPDRRKRRNRDVVQAMRGEFED